MENEPLRISIREYGSRAHQVGNGPGSGDSSGGGGHMFHRLERFQTIRMYRLRYFGLTGLSAAIEGRGFDREGL
jgi:hypothetical protein